MSSIPAAQEPLSLATLVGAPIVAAEQCRWGFENATSIVTLADGRVLIVQRIGRPALAPHKIHLAREVPPRLIAAGIAAPRLIAADATSDPPFILREYLPGAPSNSLLGDVTTALRLAEQLGALTRRIHTVDVAGAALDDAWGSPQSLAAQAAAWLAGSRTLITAEAAAALDATIAAIPERFAGRAPAFAHGDFCPVNALVEGDAVVALIDFEYARVADPLFDAAWWSWVVGFHHPARFQQIWPAFRAAAGIDDAPATAARIAALQLLYLLERLDTARRHDPADAPTWIERVAATVQNPFK
jgi:aminoglycoside phosphotransferase (APT) family kinase protein